MGDLNDIESLAKLFAFLVEYYAVLIQFISLADDRNRVPLTLFKRMELIFLAIMSFVD